MWGMRSGGQREAEHGITPQEFGWKGRRRKEKRHRDAGVCRVMRERGGSLGEAARAVRAAREGEMGMGEGFWLRGATGDDSREADRAAGLDRKRWERKMEWMEGRAWDEEVRMGERACGATEWRQRGVTERGPCMQGTEDG
ncbi:hypothetical protein C8J57DRAFT_1234289 [Mycena rebaudengoi]|nr:hypothetical protein C8J57DRAFT_1245860 [Mycena rebaudengoi]KAJ7258704.1 hypothetical protein C8J57DRAFT_1234289 [Mycena rebaudengoi]